MKTCKLFSAIALGAVALMMTGSALAQTAKNGTTLAGYKTLDICSVSSDIWTYSGVITVWNSGAIDTLGFTINDVMEYKPASKWLPSGCTVSISPSPFGEIPAGTTQETASAFLYTCTGPALPGTIRNTANMTILNHSGNLGKAFGPSPKATYTGPTPPPPCAPPPSAPSCTYTQGYWQNEKKGDWPDLHSREATFFLSGQNWQQVLETPVNVSQGYYQLAHQYIAAVLNQANGAAVPSGIQETLNLAYNWLTNNGPSACTGKGGLCGVQKDWAATLDEYNNGRYPGGPAHCE